MLFSCLPPILYNLFTKIPLQDAAQTSSPLWQAFPDHASRGTYSLVYAFTVPHTPSSEKAMAPHSSTLAWKIPWTEEPGGLQSMGSLRVGHDWATSLWLSTFMHGRRKWQPTPVFLPGESQGRGSLVGCIYGVAQNRTRLKQLSSSSIRPPQSPLVSPWTVDSICFYLSHNPLNQEYELSSQSQKACLHHLLSQHLSSQHTQKVLNKSASHQKWHADV